MQHSETLLIVDDEPGILDVYRAYLSPPQRAVEFRSSRRAASAPAAAAPAHPTYRVLLASSGEEAIGLVTKELALGQRIAAGFFDMKMPGGLDGLETIRRVRALDQDILCTVVTAYQDRSIDDINTAFSGGHEDEWDFVNKPFTENEIRQKARNLVTSWNRRRREEEQHRDLQQLMEHLSELKKLGRDHVIGIVEYALARLVDFTGSDGGFLYTLGTAPRAHLGCGSLTSEPAAAELLARTGLRERLERAREASDVDVVDDLSIVPLVCMRAPTAVVVLRTAQLSEERRKLVRIFAENASAALDNGQLVDDLRELNAALEQRVEERTVALSSSNVLLEEKTRELERLLATLRETERAMAHKERLAAMGQLAAGVAHEINNPATYVLVNLNELGGMASSMPDEGARQMLRELVDETADGVRRIVTLVGDLRVFARTDAGPHAQVKLGHTLERAERILQPQLHQRGVTLRCTSEPDISVLGSEMRLGQVMVNLMSNAIDAFDGVTRANKLIEVSCAHDGDAMVLTVSDNGCGMTQERVERVFEPFFTTKPAGKGTGLGLTIVKSVVDEHHGTIQVTSELGAGTRICVRLPPRRAEDEDDRAAAQDAEDAGDTALEADGPALTKQRILLIDDDPRVLRASTRLLEEQFEVETAPGAQAALAFLQTDRAVDAIVCDVMLPGMTGVELYQELERRAPDLARRVVFVSGGAFTSPVTSFLQQTTAPIVPKPFDTEAIGRAVDKVTKR